MFQIRQSHLQAFESAALDNFELRAVQHLRRVLPEPTAGEPDDRLRERVRDCVGRARGYGLTTERQIICFVDCTYLAGEFFDTDPPCRWAAEVLLNSALAADQKAQVTLGCAHLQHASEAEGGKGSNVGP